MRKLDLIAKVVLSTVIGTALTFTSGYAQPAQAVTLAGIYEAKGGGVAAGGNFRNGYLMAIEEINANGGILGERIELKEFPIDTAGDAARAATREALAEQPFAILGPVFSGLTLASLSVGRDAGIPHFSGAEATSISRQYPLTLYRTSMSQSGSLPRLAAFAAYALQAQKVAIIWVDNEFGRDGRDAVVKSMTRYGGSVVSSHGIKPGTQEFDTVLDAVIGSEAQALIIYTNEGEAAALLKQARAKGYRYPILGDGPLVASQVIEAAGAAAEGVYAHVAITPEAPAPRIRAFVERYQRRFGARPDHNSIKGYFAVQVLKAVAERNKSFDQKLFNEAMQSLRLDASQVPGLLNSVTYYLYGDINRESYLTQVRGGALRVIGTFSMVEGMTIDLPSGRTVNLYSREGRNALLAETGAAPVAPAARK